jgi:hypothetical protein
VKKLDDERLTAPYGRGSGSDVCEMSEVLSPLDVVELEKLIASQADPR